MAGIIHLFPDYLHLAQGAWVGGHLVLGSPFFPQTPVQHGPPKPRSLLLQTVVGK